MNNADAFKTFRAANMPMTSMVHERGAESLEHLFGQSLAHAF
jgi:hypothetical protein